MKKLLLVLQCSPFDLPMAMGLARLIADMEPSKSFAADFLFSFRKGADPDMDTVAYVARKFNTFTFQGKWDGSGWPVGPNTQMFETYQHYCAKTARKEWDYAALHLLEPDCIPTRRGWIAELQKEWHEGRQLVLGPWQGVQDCGIEHINGNLIISHEFAKRVRNFHACSPKFGWDTEFAKELMKHGRPSRLIWSDYRLGTGDNPWKGCDYLFEPKRYRDPANPLFGEDLFPCWIHGIKTMEGQQCIREKLFSH